MRSSASPIFSQNPSQTFQAEKKSSKNFEALIAKALNTTIEMDLFGMPLVNLAKTKVGSKSKPKTKVVGDDGSKNEIKEIDEVPIEVKKNST